MRILLPPSEGKTPPIVGAALDLAALSFPSLRPVREQVLGALIDVCRDDPDHARSVLGIGPALLDLVAANAELRDAPCAPAWRVYTGVLFGTLGIGSLPAGADPSRLLIASALFGLLHHDDEIPAYRLSGSVRLPGLPTAKRLWGPALREVLAGIAQEHLIVDMRSGVYADICPPRPPGWVTVRVMTLRNGRRVPVSHHNKSVKGSIARQLACGPAPGDIGGVREALHIAGWESEGAGDGVLEVLHTPPAA